MLSRCESSTLAQEKQVQGVSVIAAGRLHRELHRGLAKESAQLPNSEIQWHTSTHSSTGNLIKSAHAKHSDSVLHMKGLQFCKYTTGIFFHLHKNQLWSAAE